MRGGDLRLLRLMARMQPAWQALAPGTAAALLRCLAKLVAERTARFAPPQAERAAMALAARHARGVWAHTFASGFHCRLQWGCSSVNSRSLRARNRGTA